MNFYFLVPKMYFQDGFLVLNIMMLFVIALCFILGSFIFQKISPKKNDETPELLAQIEALKNEKITLTCLKKQLEEQLEKKDKKVEAYTVHCATLARANEDLKVRYSSLQKLQVSQEENDKKIKELNKKITELTKSREALKHIIERKNCEKEGLKRILETIAPVGFTDGTTWEYEVMLDKAKDKAKLIAQERKEMRKQEALQTE